MIHLRNFKNVLKKHFKDNVKLQYMGTDSSLLYFEAVYVYKELKEGLLSKYMGLSNFPDDYQQYSNQNEEELGLLKSETGDIPIVATNCLA